MSEQGAERTPAIEAQYQDQTPSGLTWTGATSKEAAAEAAAFLNTNYRFREVGDWQEYTA